MARSSQIGWRSLRSAVPVSTQPGLGASHSPQTPPTELGAATPTASLPWRDVRWSLAYLGFLGYVFSIVTYALPIATISIVLAALSLPFQPWKIRWPAFLGWLTAFLVWCGVTYAMSDYQVASWTALVLLFKILIITAVAANVLRTQSRLRLFAIFFLACFALYPVRGAFFNYYIYGQKYFGRAIWQFSYDNPNDLAAYCLLQMSLAAAVLVKEPNQWIRRAALAGLAVLPVLIFLTQSRGSIIALFVFGGVAVFGHRRELSSAFGKLYRTRLLVALTVVAVLAAVFAPASLWSRLAGMSKLTSASTLREADDTRSAEQRYEIWRVATRIIQENPISGVGIGAYPYAHQMTVRWELRNWFAGGQRDAHSTYLLVLAETGIPGFLLFGGITVSVIFYARRVRRRSRHALPRESLQLYYLQSGVLAFLLAGLFGSFAYLHLLYVQLALLWAWSAEVSAMLAQTPGAIVPSRARNATTIHASAPATASAG